jgi:hypothetical protein
MDIREIIRRYRAGQTIRSIASTMEYDRKTVRKYINQLRAKGMLDSETMVEYKELARIGSSLHDLVRTILTPHAFMNMRRAQGVIAIAKKYPPQIVEKAASYLVCSIGSNRESGQVPYFTAKYFQTSIEKLLQLENEPQQLQISEETQSFVRDSDYFNHTT